MSKRHRGDGAIDRRNENVWRLRYRVGGQRFSVTFNGTLQGARKELRRLLRSGDTGEHVATDKMTVGQWVEQWLAAGAPGKRQKRVGARSLQRYSELMRCHIVPTLGTRPLQQLQAVEIDRLYQQLEGKLAPFTAHLVHTVFGACLNCAVRKGMLGQSPLMRAERIPSPGESDHGTVLDQEQLHVLLDGFKGSALFPIVCVAAFTGMRRSEILALQWSDLDEKAKTLRIERAVEAVGNRPLAVKGPKTERGKRTI